MTTETGRTSFSTDVIAAIPALRAFAWTLTRSHQDVDDLVQETLTKAIANIDRFQPGTNLRAWLMTIMRNTFYNQIVKTSRERTGGEECVADTPWVADTQEWAVRGNEILAAVMALPPHYRETLILVIMLGESYETAAGICGVATGTIKSRVNRARALVLAQVGVSRAEHI